MSKNVSCNLDSSVSYNVHIDKKIYYGGDQISGFIDMVAAGATSINILNVAIVCRLRWKSATGLSSGHTLYSASKIIGRDYLIDEGLTQLPFTFGLPDDLVVTHDHAFCSVKWDARLVESDWKPVAFCRFTMSALYYTQMNMGPKVQREIFEGSKSPVLLAEVSLSRDVYQEGEPIGIRLAMHKNGAAVRSVTAHITQHVVLEDGTKNTRNQISQTMLDHTKLKHLSKKNRWTKIGAKLGSTCVRTFSCIPRVPEIRDDSTAVQLLRDSNGQQTVLTPSDVIECTDTMKSVAVSYTVDVTIHTRGCKDITCSLPFALQGKPPKQSDDMNSFCPVENCFTFPRSIEQPPEYTDYKRASVKSYTSLRPSTESVDSVFFKSDLRTAANLKKFNCDTFKIPSSLQSVTEHFQGDGQFGDRSTSLAEIGLKKRLRSLSTSNATSNLSKRRLSLSHLAAIGNPISCNFV